MIDLKIIRELLDRYSAGTAMPHEQEQVERWLKENELADNDWARMGPESREGWIKEMGEELLRHANGESGPPDAAIKQGLPWHRRFYFHLAAASVIMLIATGSWYYMKGIRQDKPVVKKTKEVIKNDVTPGSNKAVLTLADGGTVVLDDANNGVLTSQGSTEVSKQGNELVYSQEQNSSAIHIPVFNTLTTPRGGQYNLVLPDGSRVWLNAASTVKYPVAFADDNRLVEVKGEVYFEVASFIRSGKKVPFRVKVLSEKNEQKSLIEVMGTHFNINAYDEEASVNTTLLEGKVKVSSGADSHTDFAVLKPGQQAQVSNRDGAIKIIKDADTDEAVAWKNGLFMMSGADISVVLRQLARWYDVDIIYEKGMPKGKITGDIPRNMLLSEVLKVMKLSGIQCRIDGRKIIVGA
jgi:ferric-dicitrate binding protein FerR (iron transport regulator)